MKYLTYFMLQRATIPWDAFKGEIERRPYFSKNVEYVKLASDVANQQNLVPWC